MLARASSANVPRAAGGGLWAFAFTILIVCLSARAGAQTIPNAPTNLAVAAVSATQIKVSWSDTSTNEDGFKIERSLDGTSFTQVAQVQSNTTSYRDTGLFPSTTCYYRVRAYNAGGDSDYSNQAGATTPVDYFTELFAANDNDLDNQTFTFTPNGSASFYSVCRDVTNALPTNPGGGTTLLLSDDSYAQVTLNGGAQVSLYGTNYSSFFVGSNGYITFGSGDSTYSESLSAHFDRPRISALFDDLYPPSGGTVSVKQLADRVAVTWLDIAEYATSDQNTFQIELLFDGRIRISYLAIAATDGLAGLSRGTGLPADFVASDFSSYGPCVTATFVVTPTNAFSSIGVPAGPFTPDTQTYTLSNTNAAPLDWSVTKTAAWLDLSATNGMLAAGDSTNITVALNAVANTLAAGYYADTVQFKDTASGAFIARAANLGVLVPTAAPSNLTAFVADTNQVSLSWSDNSFNEDGFKIERAPDNGGSPGTWAQVATVGGNINTYTDTGLTSNATYWYRVRAYNALGDSPYSNEASAAVSGGQLITVMQWNIERHIGNVASNHTAEAKAIARIVNYNKPDVLLFNEVEDNGVAGSQAALIDWVTNSVPYLGSQPGATFYVGISSDSDGYIRNGAISRFPIANEVTYNDGLRGLHAFQIQLNGTSILQVYHAHLKCCSDGDSCGRKQSEAQNDAFIISTAAATSPLAYIFGGDWNEDESNPECTLTGFYHPITTIREVGGLVEFKPTTLSGEYRTWATYQTPSIRFDYILAATNRLSPSSGYVFSTMDWASHGLYTNASPQNLVGDNQTASDHYCVFAKYFFPGPDFTVSPTNAFASAGYIGGPFSPGQQVYTLTNTNSIPLSWGVTANASWLSVSATNGTLAAGASTNITVSIGLAANGLAAGQYAGAVGFNNAATHAFTTCNAGLTVLWPPPVPSFGGNPTVGPVPLAVAFSDTSTGNITGRSWDFGDGGTTNTVTNSLVHTYAVAGTYPVTLVVTGPGGVSTNIKPNYITVLTPYQAWQIRYFNGGTNDPNAAPEVDVDGTGQNNLFKFTAGLDPTNAASVFRITSVAQEGSNIRATWSCVAGHGYVLQSTTNGTGGGYSDPFVDISPVIVASGGGESTTNFLVIGVLAAAGDASGSVGTNPPSSQPASSAIEISALYSRGLADSSGAVPTNSLLMLGTFGIGESTIRTALATGGVSAVLSAFTPYGAPFAVGDGIGIPASWDVVVNATGFGGQQIYLVAFDQPTAAASTQMGIFTAPSWVFPGDGSQLVIDLEDVTDFVIGAHGGPLTIDSIGYTFDDTAQLAFIPAPSRYYRVRLVP